MVYTCESKDGGEIGRVSYSEKLAIVLFGCLHVTVTVTYHQETCRRDGVALEQRRHSCSLVIGITKHAGKICNPAAIRD
jgi:hypothetical protein